MLPSQLRAFRTWVEAGLAEIPNPIPPERVLWAPQDAAGLERPYVILVRTGSTTRGPRPEQRVIGTSIESNRPGTASISITVVGAVDVEAHEDQAAVIVGELEGELWQPDLLAGLEAAGLGIDAVTVIDDASSRLAGQSQWEPRSALDITFNRGTLTTSPIDPVAEVQITGTTDPPVDVGTIIVEAPPP
jgi:hypothetical protein